MFSVEGTSFQMPSQYNFPQQQQGQQQQQHHLPHHQQQTDNQHMLSTTTIKPSYSPRVHAVIQEARRVFGSRTRKPEELNLDLLKSRLACVRDYDINDSLANLLPGQVGYVSLAPYEEQNFTIGVFLLAPGATIPLHDHPEMCVVSQVISGTVEVISFDYDQDSENSTALLVDQGVYTAPSTRVLYPHSGGNFHSFTTKTGCILLDVMSPPYDEKEGRECTYFHAVPLGQFHYRLDPIDVDFEVLDMTS